MSCFGPESLQLKLCQLHVDFSKINTKITNSNNEDNDSLADDKDAENDKD